MNFSVLLSVYAKETPRYLDEALCSIWDQQTLKPGQIVLVKDGPLTEELDVCINNWKQKIGEVLTVVELPENVGAAAARNAGLEQCHNELVAIMDSDDVSMPDRFEKQIAFMESNPDIAASSAVLEEWDENLSKYIGVRTLPLEPEELKKFARYRSPLSNGVAIFRKSIILSVGSYPPFRRAQDYALWSLLLVKGYKLRNIPDILYKQRAGNKLMVSRGLRYFKGVLEILKYQRMIKFLNGYEYLRNVIIRFFSYLFPAFIKNIFYKHRHIRKYQFFIAFVDIALLVLAIFLSLCIRFLEIPSIERFSRLIPHFIPIIAVWIICFYIAGFYSLEIPRMGYRLLSHITIITVICTLLSFGYFYLNIYFPRGPRTVLVIYGVVVAALIALWRLGLNKIAIKYTAKINIAFVGIDNSVIELLQNMQSISRVKYKVKYLLDEDHSQVKEYCNVPVINDTSVFVDEIKRHKIQMVVFANDKKLSQSVQDVLFELIHFHIDFIDISDFYEILTQRIPLDAINELELLKNIDLRSKVMYRLCKQVIDVSMAFVFLLITLPFWPFIMLLIKLSSPGPVFDKQKCTGYLAQPFTIIKFRTMGADSQVTGAGKFLRKTGIDELPQFLNIIKSDMSFIGPCPEGSELMQELEHEVPFYRQRLLAKPGLTGWDQVSGKYHSLSREDTCKKLQYDLYYIKNMSFFLDVAILFRMMFAMEKRGGV